MKMWGSRWLFAAGTVGAVVAGLQVSVQAQPAGKPPQGAKPKAGAAAAAAPAAPVAVSAAADAGVAPPTPMVAPAVTASTPDAGAGSSFLPPPTSAATSGGVNPVTAVRPMSPPPPPPTPAQVAAYNALKAETDAFETGARDYRDTVTTIIRLHYEAKKKEILSGLDTEIGVEQAELKKARENAIKRLEEFIATYSGSRAKDPETPDAMYRLAALYEERARDTTQEDISGALKPAIALYKRVLNEYPNYKRNAAVFYFLAHAYEDSGRNDEAQQVYRSLVCHNHFKYPTPPNPKNPEQDTVIPLPQDHDEEFWSTWRNLHPDPPSLKKGGQEMSYVEPYPQDCTPLPSDESEKLSTEKKIAEVWWDIGNWEFDQLDFGGGVVKDEPFAVYDYNRASSAYQHAMTYHREPVYSVALYKWAWTLFKQSRYEAATKAFVQLLLYTDELQKQTGDPGLNFRLEAYSWIGGSLDQVDFVGPGPNEPVMQRPDIIDTEPDPAKAEIKLHVAIDRVKDPALIPQDKPWTINIYRSLAEEFRSINEFNNAIEVYTEMLKRWPMDPTAPDTQAALAETYDQMNITKRVGTPEHDAIAAKSLEARTALANYIGNTPWVDANKDNPEALANAERLVKGGLRLAAGQHTNNGNAAITEALNTADPGRQADLLQRALAEYKLAALGWGGYLHQDENAADAYESRYWLAQARDQEVKVEVALNKLKKGPPPTSQEIAEAKQAAIDVRDSNEDDKYLMNAALFVVGLSDVDRDLALQQFVDTNGAAGIDDRQSPRRDNTGPNGGPGKPIVDPVPVQIQASIQAREDYVARVPPALDTPHNAIEFQTWNAGQYFLYGHFDDARARYEPIYKEHCGKDRYGYTAWEHLITMSNMQGDAERSRQLAEAEANKQTACAMSPEDTAKADLIVNPTLQEAAYAKAQAKMKEAQAAQPGPERDKLWRETAGLYEAALQAAPDRDEAPEGAMNAAYAYKQVGDFNRAIDMYNKFLSSYGSEQRLTTLQKGDPKTKAAPDLKRYQERVKYVSDAYAALSTTYYSFFNYQRAAETQEKISTNSRFDDKTRKDAASTAMGLYNALGQRDKLLAQYKILTSLHPDQDEQAKADYAVADYEYRLWNPQGGDVGQNRQVRIDAETSLMQFYAKQHTRPAAAKYALEAAYQVAKMKKAAGDGGYHQWMKTVTTQWEFVDHSVPAGKDGKKDSQTPPYVDYAAECEFTLLDEEIHAKYDYETGHHHYAGSVEDILGKHDPKTKKALTRGKYQVDADDAQKYDLQLEHIARTYQSLDWVPAALARKGSLYDSLRTGLYNTVPPALKFFTPQQEALLKRLENSGRDDLAAQADDLRSSVKEGWRAQKEIELSAMDTLMVRNYSMAVAEARKYNVRNAWVAKAVNRLAYYTDIIGDAKMREYVTGTIDPTDPSKAGHLGYNDNQFVQQRPGLAAVPPPEANAVSMPVAP